MALYSGGSALARFACVRSGRRIGPSHTPVMYLLAALNDRQLGLMVPEQLTTGLIEIQSTADHPLYLSAGWQVAKVQDCDFAPRGPPRLVPCQQQVAVNVVSVSGVRKSPMPPRDKDLGSTVAATTAGPWELEMQRLDRSGDPGSDRIPTRELLRDARRNREMYCAERAHTPDRETRPPRPRPVSPDPDRNPAPAAESAKPYHTTEDGSFIPKLPLLNSCLSPRGAFRIKGPTTRIARPVQ